ncbi:MAG TPA: DUF4294 domain-containing protein [Chitinophagaceae bacterium]|nr:DUF4294 domain-containing protein [Chitinophagaceae bacterium]
MSSCLIPGRSLFLLLFLLIAGLKTFSQVPDSVLKNIPQPVLGPNDTIPVPAIIHDGELIPFRTEPGYIVSAPMSPAAKAARAKYESWTRLRNAVYVTYPYARRCGYILNDINVKLAAMDKRRDRKAYIKTREKELKKEFSDPLENLSVYQGKVLMKLINRQTGNNCYEIIREYKGGLTARFYQTVAFFYNSSLKQPYEPQGEDQQIEIFAQEVERMYGIRY